MPLYEVTDEELVPFRRISSGSDLYEREIEDLMWDNIEAFTGDALFRVCRQPRLSTGGRPDIVALDRTGRVHVIEIKRDIDRGQLAQCLEYAGWAKGTNLDELAGMFHEGQDEFFAAWTEFTESTAPQLVSDSPRLTLVARDFDERTAGALSFLTDSNLPISVLRVTVYEDQERRRFVDIDGDHEPEWEVAAVEAETAAGGRTPVHLKIDGRRVQISDLMDHELLAAGETLTWHRPRTGSMYSVTVTDTGGLKLESGAVVSSPSRAAMDAAAVGSYDGWTAWRNADGILLDELRRQMLHQLAKAELSSTAATAEPHSPRQPDSGEPTSTTGDEG